MLTVMRCCLTNRIHALLTENRQGHIKKETRKASTLWPCVFFSFLVMFQNFDLLSRSTTSCMLTQKKASFGEVVDLNSTQGSRHHLNKRQIHTATVCDTFFSFLTQMEFRIMRRRKTITLPRNCHIFSAWSMMMVVG